KHGNPKAFDFPRPMIYSKDLNFSFSGLKTAVRTTIEKFGENIDDETKADICASFQNAICDIIEKKMKLAIKKIKNLGIKHIVTSGGVARNSAIRNVLDKIATSNGMKLIVAEPKYCSDNGVMIAFAGEQNYLKGKTSSFSVMPRPRWPLEELKNE
ncbi:MAG: tRNA (adenosine(37)-N6)-threonylcarbamoyltransferase complex transferase subunit TsaD, partial [Alphaproteobacteria bacterium]|nr:tRNA (adenosine(37)-N6)-threonylcarbamoyltransferase complex transferase subunit TsaD [Alphaproteobacteria bacterium]